MSKLPSLEATKPIEDKAIRKIDTITEQVKAEISKLQTIEKDESSNEKQKWKFPEDEGIIPVDFDGISDASPNNKPVQNEKLETMNQIKVSIIMY